ncbi:neurosecretory protein VGF-like [Sinocyclocheilus rhinocerous]|uniref:Neurosecretory protein VGF-like n=1 Tax=Sinocyclocheilus rhinocerous TaxID=307959 RepID=A0A673G2R0_9TELE|nr:PREDICTED: neurosecretory protein VGF-like [Sinocyclocheilus rhinocerous]
MIWWQQTSNVPLIFLFMLFSLTFNSATFSPVTADRNTVSDNYAASSSAQQQAQYTQPAGEQGTLHEEKEDDELFKDVDPRTLAAVLLEALNQPQKEKMSEREDGGTEVEKEKDLQGADRDRDGHKELELVMAAAAAQGKDEKEREEEEEKKRAEEEQLTEKVTSRTTSQTVPLKEQVAPQEGATKEEVIKEEERQEPERGELGEEEEQLSPEEVKNLETMLEEFQSYSTATKRERDMSTGQRESRGEYFDYLDRNGLMNNEIKPKAKGNDLALSKKKLKWQLEQEKNKIQNSGNLMDDFTNNLSDPEEEDEEDQEDEEQLSPEEEETRAKAEQEEVRRQAAEAQRAKAEEEKLADIASDMLLKYIMKQDKKKYQDNNGAEDKRSDEEDTSNDDDDIDPQTIDKLIEISSKLHLPADDVVDIINDVEKKKKKDAPENLPWQHPLVPPPAPIAPSTLLQKPPPSKPPQPNTNPLKAWFKDRASFKPSKQDFWMRQQWPFRTYPSYNFYQKPYRGYYPTYVPPPKPRSRYYPKPSFSLNDVLGNSLDYDFDYSPRRKSRPWAHSRQRLQPAFQRNLYFPHPRTFKAVPMPKPRSPPRRWPSFYYPARAPVVTREDDYYSPLRQPPQDSEEELENFIERVFMKHPRMFQ